MNLTHLRRILTAGTVSLALLAAMTTPAGAASYIAEITYGQITLRKVGLIPPEVIDLAPGGGGSCGFGNFFNVSTNPTTGSSTFDVTGLYGSQVKTFGTTGTFLMVLTRYASGNIVGTVTSATSPYTLTGLRVALAMTIYNTTSCTPTGTAICSLASLVNISGTLTGLSTGDTYSVTGSTTGTVVAAPTCTSGPSYLVGTTAVTTSTYFGGYLV